MKNIASIIIRNESFGGVFFNQKNGKTIMMDQDGLLTLIKFLEKKPLNHKEKKFTQIFFSKIGTQQIKLLLKPSIKFRENPPLITNTPILIDLSLNNYCNLHCPYCYMSAESIEHGEHLSMSNFNSLLHDMKKSRVVQIALGGGEPTLHPNFSEILKKLRIEGDIIPNYTTNGSNLTPDILEASKKYCGAVAVSYSEEREEKTLSAVKKLIQFGIQTNLHIVLLKTRIQNLFKIIEKYANLGISSVVLLLFKPMGRGANLKQEILTVKEKKTFSLELLKILALQKRFGVRLAIDACSAFTVKDFPFLPESVDGCTGAMYSAYIDWDLKMKPCSFMQDTDGIDLKHYSIAEAWKSDCFENFRKTILNPRYEGCKGCDFFSSCWGGCPLNPELTFCIEKGKKIS